LNKAIVNVVELHSYNSLKDMVYMAMKVEKQQGRRAYSQEITYTNLLFDQPPTKKEGPPKPTYGGNHKLREEW
jgi:hypothetical protein